MADFKKDILDKAASISKAETTSSAPSKKGRKVDVKTLHFDINEDEDTELSIFVKQLINKEQITNKLVYDTFGRSEGWNMIYGLSKGSVSWDRVKKWCELMGYRVEITLAKMKKDK
jgi:hypothetical protein